MNRHKEVTVHLKSPLWVFKETVCWDQVCCVRWGKDTSVLFDVTPRVITQTPQADLCTQLVPLWVCVREKEREEGMDNSVVAVQWLTWLWKIAPGTSPRGCRDCGVFMKYIPVVPASVTRRPWIKLGCGRLPKCERVERERRREGDFKEGRRGIEGDWCWRSERIMQQSCRGRLTVHIIDVSILVVIAGRECGSRYFTLCLSHSGRAATAVGNICNDSAK